MIILDKVGGGVIAIPIDNIIYIKKDDDCDYIEIEYKLNTTKTLYCRATNDLRTVVEAINLLKKALKS